MFIKFRKCNIDTVLHILVSLTQMTHNALSHIYFPGLRSNLGGFCTSCHVCLILSSRKVPQTLSFPYFLRQDSYFAECLSIWSCFLMVTGHINTRTHRSWPLDTADSSEGTAEQGCCWPPPSLHASVCFCGHHSTPFMLVCCPRSGGSLWSPDAKMTQKLSINKTTLQYIYITNIFVCCLPASVHMHIFTQYTLKKSLFLTPCSLLYEHENEIHLNQKAGAIMTEIGFPSDVPRRGWLASRSTVNQKKKMSSKYFKFKVWSLLALPNIPKHFSSERVARPTAGKPKKNS